MRWGYAAQLLPVLFCASRLVSLCLAQLTAVLQGGMAAMFSSIRTFSRCACTAELRREMTER